MPIVVYSPTHFERLSSFARQIGPRLSLAHRPFVNYYYASQVDCNLHLFVLNDGKVVATYGQERMRFLYNGEPTTVCFGSNFYSLQSGIGGFLFLQCHKEHATGLVFGGSANSHRMARSRKWTYYPGVKVYVFNKPYRPHPTENFLRIAAKAIVRSITQSKLMDCASRISPILRARISVREESEYSEDLLPHKSPFTFRFAPQLDYLKWRYSTRLPFVRYRLFRVLDRGETAGYVIINDAPENIIVAQCDGIDGGTLAYGVLMSVLETGREDQRPRSATLTSSHPEMQRIYECFGFRPEREDRPFYMGTLQGGIHVPPDTTRWLVNFDWGDNGLRPPFLNQSEEDQTPVKGQSVLPKRADKGYRVEAST